MKQTAAIIFRSAVLLLAGMALGLLINNRSHNSDDALKISVSDHNKLDKVMQLVKVKYVDSVNTDSVEGAAINHLLQKLDPHSVYLRKQQAQSLNDKLQGGFDGIGIESQLIHDTLFVAYVYPGSPAARAGLPNGVRIIRINNLPFAGTHLDAGKINEAFNSKNQTSLELSVAEHPDQPLKTYRIRPSHITLSSLDAAYLTAPTTGYIKISKFGATTDVDFKAALKRLKAAGMQKLVLDLRGNGGGYLNTATALADEFLPKGKLIVYTKGLHEPRTDYFATDSGLYEKGKLALLIDEHSASASEIVAGALQDLDRAVIIGRRSFGKGLVQEQFMFQDSSALNLTVARYYTPSGRSIQKSYKNGAENYRNELTERLQKGEMYTAENNLDDSSQSGSAFHTAGGKKVYGGGGIMPDIFVPESPAMNTLLVQDLKAKQLFSAYVLERMQHAVTNYNTAADFIKNYIVSDDELTSFIVYATASLKDMDSHEIALAKSYMKLMLKAQAIRFKWGNEAYHKFLNQNDADVAKAIAALN